MSTPEMLPSHMEYARGILAAWRAAGTTRARDDLLDVVVKLHPISTTTVAYWLGHLVGDDAAEVCGLLIGLRKAIDRVTKEPPP